MRQRIITRAALIALTIGLNLASGPAFAQDVIAEGPRPKYDFSADDQKLLDEIQFGAFQFFWKEVGNPVPLVKDRVKGPVCSIAAVGFQLASLPIGVERGWVKRDEAEKRAVAVLKGLLERDDNKYDGMYLHFPDLNTGGVSKEGYTNEASTIDSALMFAGAMAAASYFQGETAKLVDQMLADANWLSFTKTRDDGFMSMAYHIKPGQTFKDPGEYTKHAWHVASDEERLVYFIAVGSPTAAHAIPPETYYKLKRDSDSYNEQPPFVISPQGTLFHYFFANCYIDMRGYGADDPAAFGGTGPRVDWFENSVRATIAHRQRCIDMASKYKTLGPNRWGLSACDSFEGYAVPEILPNLAKHEKWYEGLIAPYAAGSAIMFTPKESVAALREFRELKWDDGKPVAWRDPAQGGYGLVDSFQLERKYASDDTLGIDHGPMIVAIENARSGLIWKLFMEHPGAKRAIERLKWKPLAD